jgi:hypothetical protein
MGSFSGYMNETTVSGYPAYEVGGFGWEAYCPQQGYVVDYGDGRVLQVIFEGDTENPDYPMLETLFDSLVIE